MGQSPRDAWLATRAAMRGRTARAFLLYIIAFALAGATPLLLLPILTRMLSPEELGRATGFLIAAMLIANVSGLSAHGLVAVRFFKMERADFARLVGAGLLAVLLSHLVVALGMLPWVGLLETAFELPATLWLCAVLAALVLSFNQSFLAMFQVAGDAAGYLKSRALQSFIEIAACGALLVLLAQDERARVYSYTVAVSLAAVYGFRSARQRGLVSGGGGREEFGAVLRYGLPLLPHVVCGTAITYLDRVIVGATLGAQELGLYTAASQIGMVMMLAIEPLNKAMVPWLYGQLAIDDPAVKRKVVKATYAFHGALLAFGAIVAVTATMLFDVIVGPEYRSAKPLVPFVVLGFVFQGMYYSVVNYVNYAEKTAWLSLVTVSIFVLGSLICLGLVSRFGLMGAAFAFALNNLLLFLAVWLVSTRAVSMPWSLRA